MGIFQCDCGHQLPTQDALDRHRREWHSKQVPVEVYDYNVVQNAREAERNLRDLLVGKHAIHARLGNCLSYSENPATGELVVTLK